MSKPSAFSRLSRPMLVATAVLGLGLGGCATPNRNLEAQADIPDNYTERHPIVMGDVPKSIDVFLAPNDGLDYRQKRDVREFVKGYKAAGKGALVLTLPPAAPGGAVQKTVAAIRTLAVAEGVPAGQIRTASGPTHPTAASVRMTYSALSAKVVSQCGQWPHDFTGGSTLQSWANKPYYNHGCSYQTMMAAQVADPMDHVRSRPEEAGDIGKRMADIESIREATDPSTQWKTSSDKINKSF